uniref:Putative secreted protein n=2 Tax=Nyssomyia neivai TaxID=330878 RepID=A0A1L8DND7_9DIPT
MNFMIVAILLIGAASLSSQSPIADNTVNQIVLGYPEAESDATDDLDTAENYIFMPYFRYNHRKTLRRHAREATPEDFSAELPQIQQEDVADDFEPAEDMAIMPYFRYMQRKTLKRGNRIAETWNNHRRSIRSVESEIPEGGDDLEVAENHIFLPVFRYKQRAAYRQRVKKVKNNQG